MITTDKNQSASVIFILLGFSDYPDLKVPLFLLFLTIYMVTVMGNLGMIVIIRINPKLHTPMYFFLSHLSFVDFCYSTGVTPKLLENLVVEDRTISFEACLTQFFFTAGFVVIETFLLAVMAYDRFMAIYKPLLYTVSMSQKLCAFLVAAAYSWGILSSLIFTYTLIILSFCGTKVINNFLCEYTVILSASCSDKHFSEIIFFIVSNIDALCTLFVILTSYICIFVTIMKMHSGSGRRKAFSTCASHLTAVTIFYGTILFLYCVPNSKSSWLMVRVTSVFYPVVIPMLNPLIYSLRNKDVKETLKKLMNIEASTQ
ncbi:olfactory receptor 5D13-like [Dromiciops gliroides]|uniref:olfactory receptor 5D13-like n=1 Tax=Dromiciops gliroides TaxID=33562 RepID=UPI001CC5B2C7|nr:olfactory receptor 5D13-like [Dromiciops gliroides]